MSTTITNTNGVITSISSNSTDYDVDSINSIVSPDEITEEKTLYETFEEFRRDKSSTIHRLMMSNKIYTRDDYDDANSFYLFPRNDPYKMLGTTREYLFITKPDLHIFGYTDKKYQRKPTNLDRNAANLNPELNNMPFFRMLAEHGWLNTVLSNLQFSSVSTDKSGPKQSPFINIFSNYKNSNIDLSEISVGEDETGVNIYNTKIFYRKPSDSADEDNEFSIEFKDNKYLDCYLWFKAYDLYEQQKYHGIVTPVDPYYITNKILSDQMTVFKITVGDDGETIIHWAELWGCFPTNVPRNIFSELPEDGQLKFTVSWKATFQQDMDPISITHFNTLCQLIAGDPKESNNPDEDLYEYIKLYDNTIGAITGESALCPYIELKRDPHREKFGDHLENPNLRDRYVLKWIKSPNKNIYKENTNKNTKEFDAYTKAKKYVSSALENIEIMD